MYDLVGVGNFNVDTLVFVDDFILEGEGMRKGNAHYKDIFYILKERLKDYKQKHMPGGSVANTVTGAHNLGVKCLLHGIVGRDDLGQFYIKDLVNRHIKHRVTIKHGKTANCLCLITPDKQRTFASDMGVADTYEKDDLPYDMIKPGCVFHTATYTLEGAGQSAILDLIKYSKENNAKCALDMGYADYIERELSFMRDLIEKNIDFVFCNEEEAESLAQMKADKAVDFLGELCEIAVVTLGKKGAVIKNKNKKYKIPCYPAKVVDTTGAGDAFRAGFYYGFFKTRDIEKAGRMGSYYSSKVVECMGARLSEKIEDLENRI